MSKRTIDIAYNDEDGMYRLKEEDIIHLMACAELVEGCISMPGMYEMLEQRKEIIKEFLSNDDNYQTVN